MRKSRTFRVGLEMKAKHGALLEALERRGWNQRQGAAFLGISPSRFGDIINMKEVPKERSGKLAIKLFELTGQQMEELWPDEVFTKEFLAAPKNLKRIRDVPVHLLVSTGLIPALPPPTPEESYLSAELEEALRDALLQKLSPREQTVIHARFFEGKTLREVGKEMGVANVRIQQIEHAAIRKLKKPGPTTRKLRKLFSPS